MRLQSVTLRSHQFSESTANSNAQERSSKSKRPYLGYMYCGSVYSCGSNLLKLLKIDDYVEPKQRSEIVHRALRNVHIRCSGPRRMKACRAYH